MPEPDGRRGRCRRGVGVAAPAHAAPDGGRDADGHNTGGGPKAVTPGFKAIPPNRLDTFIVPNGYDHHVVARWGDPVPPGAPAFDVRRQSAAAQKKQFGYNNDFVAVVPLSNERALLVCVELRCASCSPRTPSWYSQSRHPALFRALDRVGLVRSYSRRISAN